LAVFYGGHGAIVRRMMESKMVEVAFWLVSTRNSTAQPQLAIALFSPDFKEARAQAVKTMQEIPAWSSWAMMEADQKTVICEWKTKTPLVEVISV